MKKVEIARLVLLTMLAFAVVLGPIAQAATPYLPLVGPPPLRFQPAKKTAAPATVAFVPTSKPETGAKASTPSASDNSASKPVVDSKITDSASSSTPAASATNSTVAAVLEMPTPDLIGISPEMLASYFRAVTHGTNTAVVVGSYPLSFVPPVPADKSSQATYNVK